MKSQNDLFNYARGCVRYYVNLSVVYYNAVITPYYTRHYCFVNVFV